MFSHVKPEEWRWVLLASLLILSMSTLPYLVGYSAQNAEMIFSGAVFDRQDFAVHLATMHSGRSGDWLYRLRFTSEPHPGAYVKLFYIFLGHVSRWIGFDLVVTYHMGRWFFGTLTFFVLYALVARWAVSVQWRRLTTLFAVLGSGLGWLQLIFGWVPVPDISPMDFWLVDAYPFFGIQIFPHFAAVAALLGSMILAFLRYVESYLARWAVLTGLCAVGIQLVQPYAPILGDLAVSGFVIGLWMKRHRFPKREILSLLLIGAAQIPLLVYNLQVFRSNPIWQEFANQNMTLSPPPLYFLWGLGLFWPFVPLGVWAAFRDRDPILFGALTWAVGAALLAYVPIGLQRRFVFGVTIPLAFLAVAGIKDVLAPWVRAAGLAQGRLNPGTLASLVIALSTLSTLYLSLGTSLFLAGRPDSLYDPIELIAAAGWLSMHADQGDIVLSDGETGQLLAVEAGIPVYIGHPMETVGYEEKSRKVAAYYRGEIGLEDLPGPCCDWVLWHGATLPGVGLPGPSGHPQVVYQGSDVVIYRVSP
jgi:hypothetical protein